MPIPQIIVEPPQEQKDRALSPAGLAQLQRERRFSSNEEESSAIEDNDDDLELSAEATICALQRATSQCNINASRLGDPQRECQRKQLSRNALAVEHVSRKPNSRRGEPFQSPKRDSSLSEQQAATRTSGCGEEIESTRLASSDFTPDHSSSAHSPNPSILSRMLSRRSTPDTSGPLLSCHPAQSLLLHPDSCAIESNLLSPFTGACAGSENARALEILATASTATVEMAAPSVATCEPSRADRSTLTGIMDAETWAKYGKWNGEDSHSYPQDFRSSF